MFRHRKGLFILPCGKSWPPEDLYFAFSSSVSEKDNIMAKSQKKSNREVRKPKAEKTKTNASKPSEKGGVVPGLEHMKR